MKKLLTILGLLAVVGGLAYVFIPGGLDEAQQLEKAEVSEAKEVTSDETTNEHPAHELSASNTSIGFSCAKTLAGKTLTMRGGWSGNFDSHLTGQLVMDEATQSPKQINLLIDVGSLWSEHEQLTEALKTKGFFQVDEYPQATFESTTIRPASMDGKPQDSTSYEIEGNFTLNGITKSLTIPATFEAVDSGNLLQSQFSLRREDFNVRFTDAAGFGLLTDENISDLVALNVSIDTSKKASSATQTDLASAKSRDSAAPPDISELPSTFEEEIPSTLVKFEMVLVPGDPDEGIPPLYVGQDEVTWDEFMPWVDGRDLDDKNSLGELRAMKLRPSPPYGTVDRGFGMDGRPAIGMSRLSAMKYCEWLSKQTGKHYRLPTEEEWERIYKLGGGNLENPPSAEAATESAVFVDTSWNDDLEDWATQPVGSTEPNALGIFDMAGNVCEWVTDTGEERVARGGHFDSDLDALGVGRHVEDPYWNRDYPNEPKSIWWFVNARWVGFRLVCDANEVIASEATN